MTTLFRSVRFPQSDRSSSRSTYSIKGNFPAIQRQSEANAFQNVPANLGQESLTTPGQIIHPAWSPLPKEESQASKPSGIFSPATNQKDENWGRLQTIYRKHHGQSETESVESNLHHPPSQNDEPKPGLQEMVLRNIIQPPQKRDTEPSSNTSEATTEAESVKPSTQGTSQGHEPPKHSIGHGLRTIFRKRQEQAETKSFNTPEAMQSVAPQHKEPATERLWHAVKSIFR
jgi:hypothetical protein